MPKSFDPARVAAPPETDIVRAIFDGLTETESKTLKAIPSIAVSWTSSEDNRIWKFKLRKNAKWSNGSEVTAKDFVDSWKRLLALGEKTSHRELLKNIVGFESETPTNKKEKIEQEKRLDRKKDETSKTKEKTENLSVNRNLSFRESPKNETANSEIEGVPEKTVKPENKVVSKTGKHFGVRAIGDYELEVSLKNPDREFPKLVAHPIFRPVYDSGKDFESDKLSADIVTNGAFVVSSLDENGVVLERSDHYWNRRAVKLERVHFVPAKDADSALKAYRDGRVDAVTNADFEPLVLKLLTPYIDFHRTTHGALNFYEFNREKAPFNDRRVREALAISIDRKRLSEDEMDGATKPAFNFLPHKSKNRKSKFVRNIEKAKNFMKKAGFENGKEFPRIRLVINRNNIQQRIAKAVAKMWKQHLNVDTEIITMEKKELEIAKNKGDFDLIRRGVVLPTPDETANMLSLFKPEKTKKNTKRIKKSIEKDDKKPDLENGTNRNEEHDQTVSTRSDEPASTTEDTEHDNEDKSGALLVDIGGNDFILTEEEAIKKVPAIPLFFSSSYSLVKPYVVGFEMNTLDAPSLKEIQIDIQWQPEKSDAGE